MSRHVLSLRYDGLRAEHGEIGTSASKQIIQGAQIFLGAHAHYFLSGSVPDRINERGAGFELTQLARIRGSHTADFVINILSNGIWDATKYGFGLFVLDSYRAWSERRLFEDPPCERLEPYLAAPRVSNAPFIDQSETALVQRQRLSGRIGQAMGYITSPNGTSSAYLEMSMDGKLFEKVSRRYITEEELTDAIMAFRESRRPSRRLS